MGHLGGFLKASWDHLVTSWANAWPPWDMMVMMVVMLMVMVMKLRMRVTTMIDDDDDDDDLGAIVGPSWGHLGAGF